MKLYILGPEDNGEGVYFLTTEKGEVLASHLCSNIGFAKHDLIMGRPERIKEWEKRFGKLKVSFVDYDMVSNKEETAEVKKGSREDLLIK